MSNIKYVGMDVHKSITVWKLVCTLAYDSAMR